MKKSISFLLALIMLVSMAAVGSFSAAAEAAPAADEILGTKEDGEYVSELLGICASFPADWNLLNAEETAQVMGYAADATDNEALAEILRNSGSVCDLYAIRLDNSGDNINIQLEDLGTARGAVLTEESYMELSMPALEQGMRQIGIENLKIETEDYTFAGASHVSVFLSGTANGHQVYERMVLIKSGRYMASVTAFSLDAQKLDEMFSFFKPLEVAAEDALGEKSGNTYYSELLGLEATLPDSWYIFSAEETAQVMGILADGFDDAAVADALRKSGTACDLYAMDMMTGTDNMNIQLEDLGKLYGSFLTPEQYAQIAIPQLEPALSKIGFQNIEITTENYEMAGSERYSIVVSAEVNGVPVYERMILIKAGQYMGCITMFSLQLSSIDAVFACFRAA